MDNSPWSQPLMLYDGDCGFCTTSALASQGKWFRSRVEAVPFQQVDLVVHNLTVDKCAETLHVVESDGGLHVGSDAIAVVLRHSRAPWPVVGGLLRLPGVRWLAQKTYAWVARNRHKLPGGTPACDL